MPKISTYADFVRKMKELGCSKRLYDDDVVGFSHPSLAFEHKYLIKMLPKYFKVCIERMRSVLPPKKCRKL